MIRLYLAGSLLVIALQLAGCAGGADLGPVTREQMAAASQASVAPQFSS